MQNVKSYIDKMFIELPKSKKTRELKQEILLNVDARFQELSGQNIDRAEIESILISEIGSAEELMENINLTNNTKRFVIIGLELVLLILAISYIAYTKANEQIYISTFEVYPLLLSSAVAFPLAYFLTVNLFLNILNHFLILPRILTRRFVKISSFTVSMFLFLLYLLYLMHAFSIYNIMPSMLAHFMSSNLNLIAGITGLFFCFGTINNSNQYKFRKT
ncbi:MAG TPA: hypothetical protein DCG38_10040 [Eubacteriaceae bacterium]|nr:hypothetical protein [Eubacteriaceae bacterium]